MNFKKSPEKCWPVLVFYKDFSDSPGPFCRSSAVTDLPEAIMKILPIFLLVVVCVPLPTCPVLLPNYVVFAVFD